MPNEHPKVAIVHDWLVSYAGADRVVDCMHHVFPDAPIYTLVYDEKKMPEWFRSYDVRTTWVQKLPFATRIYKKLLPLMPRAFEALDLSEYDLVLSSSSSCSKGVITRPDAVHICYCHTPTRYVWDFYYTYRANANPLVRAVMPGQMYKLRQWDKCAADRVDYFIANSRYIARRIKKYYRRDSDVIYPCVHINESPFVAKEDFYLVVGRFTWYKRIDLAVAACTKLGRKLVVIGSGDEEARLRAIAGPTVQFLGGGLSDEEVRGYYLRAKAFLFRARKTSASPRSKRRAPGPRCSLMAAAARARRSRTAAPACCSTRRRRTASPPVSSALRRAACPARRNRSAPTAAASANSALRKSCAPTAPAA